MTETVQEPGALAAKLAKVYAVVGKIRKGGHNREFNYDFVTESDASEAIRSHLAKLGVMMFVSVVDCQDVERTTRSGTIMTVSTVELLVTFVDGATGQRFVVAWYGRGFDSQDKSVSKAITSGVKYLLLKTFLIPTGDDPDNDGAIDPEPPAARRAQQATAKPKPQAPPQEPATAPVSAPAARSQPAGGTGTTKPKSQEAPLQRLVAKYGGQTNTWAAVRAAKIQVTRLAQLTEEQIQQLLDGEVVEPDAPGGYE